MNIALILKGAAMGIAEAIPGVSGGTLAFITGIYEELLQTIKSITPANLKLVLTDRKAFWKAINGSFLLMLLIGMVGGIVVGVLVISHMLENSKEILWSLFFGLVAASAIYLGRDVKWDIKNIGLAIIGAVITYFITMISPVEGSDNPLYIFFAGAIAISALMLPGISGSFILLILGLYDKIINGLKALISEQDFSQLLTLIIFGLGVLTGLFTFARLLSWLFKKYHNPTMALMIGVLIGSLNKLWPWKKILTAMDKSSGKISEINNTILPDADNWKILTETNLMPGDYSIFSSPQTLACIIALAIGAGIVGLLSTLDKREA